MEKSIWKKGVREDTSVEGLGPYNRVKGGVYTKKGKSVFTIKRRKRGSIGIHGEPTEKRVYLTFQVAPNLASILCSKKGWKAKNGTRLLTCKPIDDKE